MARLVNNGAKFVKVSSLNFGRIIIWNSASYVGKKSPIFKKYRCKH